MTDATQHLDFKISVVPEKSESMYRSVKNRGVPSHFMVYHAVAKVEIVSDNPYDLIHDLSSAIGEEKPGDLLRTDLTSRILYSTDA
jgi:hypothetical protein